MTNKIVFENVPKSYGKFKALDGIDLEIPEGMFGLLGPNGAGKTTFMNILVTYSSPLYGLEL
jgi:ABC-2 type transport system ATP-binding protein